MEDLRSMTERRDSVQEKVQFFQSTAPNKMALEQVTQEHEWISRERKESPSPD